MVLHPAVCCDSSLSLLWVGGLWFIGHHGCLCGCDHWYCHAFQKRRSAWLFQPDRVSGRLALICPDSCACSCNRGDSNDSQYPDRDGLFIGGQTFNFALQSLGAFVHSLRLQFVEFFGQFYVGGGREFMPFSAGRVVTELIEEDR